MSLHRIHAVLAALAAFTALALLASTASAQAVAAPSTLAIVDTHAVGAEPAVGTLVTQQIRRAAEKLGYTPVEQPRVRAALSQLGTPGPIGSGELWEVARRTPAARSIVANVHGSGGGAFSIEIQVASADRQGPWRAEGTCTGLDIPEVVDRLVAAALPAPALGQPKDPDPDDAEPPGASIVLQTESAFGVAGAGFYNHLIGGRLDYAFSSRVTAGAYIAYVNLRGQDGRVSNVFFAGMIEYRIQLGGGDVGIPLRFTPGFLPKNGPTLQPSAGIDFRLGGGTRLGFQLLAPTLWNTHDEPVTSFDVSAEVGFAL